MTNGAGGRDDIAFQASVDDGTLEFFDEFDANIDRITQSAEEGFARLDGSIADTGKSVGILGGIITPPIFYFANLFKRIAILVLI